MQAPVSTARSAANVRGRRLLACRSSNPPHCLRRALGAATAARGCSGTSAGGRSPSTVGGNTFEVVVASATSGVSVPGMPRRLRPLVRVPLPPVGIPHNETRSVSLRPAYARCPIAPQRPGFAPPPPPRPSGGALGRAPPPPATPPANWARFTPPPPPAHVA